MTPAKRGRGSQRGTREDAEEPALGERRAAMTWAQRLKRVFDIDIGTCRQCGGALKVIACVEDPTVIRKIRTDLEKELALEPGGLLPVLDNWHLIFFLLVPNLKCAGDKTHQRH